MQDIFVDVNLSREFYLLLQAYYEREWWCFKVPPPRQLKTRFHWCFPHKSVTMRLYHFLFYLDCLFPFSLSIVCWAKYCAWELNASRRNCPSSTIQYIGAELPYASTTESFLFLYKNWTLIIVWLIFVVVGVKIKGGKHFEYYLSYIRKIPRLCTTEHYRQQDIWFVKWTRIYISYNIKLVLSIEWIHLPPGHIYFLERVSIMNWYGTF